MIRVLSILLLFTFIGCNSNSSDTGNSSLEGRSYKVSGTLTYDYVPIINSGLNYEGTYKKPMRNVFVEVIRTADNVVLTSTTTNDEGAYNFTIVEKMGPIHLAIWAKMVTPSVTIEDNTNSNAEYVILTSDYTITGDMGLPPINAPSGWSGTNSAGSYTSTRMAAPFAILDSIYSAVKKVHEARSHITFPPLKVNWSINNIAASGSISLGQIGTSHYDGNELYILGRADSDSDEYDRHVIVHEWGHYFEDKLSRSDSIGGQHSGGEVLHKSLAFGEAWGNSLSGMVFDPDVNYRDSIGLRQQTIAINRSMESSSDPAPGWFSEISLQEILFDIYDSNPEANDSLALGIGPIIDVLTGPQVTTPALTSIFSFIHNLKNLYSSSSGLIDTITAAKAISNVADVYGSSETNDGGNPDLLPVYESLVVGGGTLTVNLEGPTARYNEAGNNRFFKFTAINYTTDITWTSSDTYYFEVFRAGQTIDWNFEQATSSTPLGPYSTSVATIPGQVYIINVRTYPDYMFGTGGVQFDVSIQ